MIGRWQSHANPPCPIPSHRRHRQLPATPRAAPRAGLGLQGTEDGFIGKTPAWPCERHRCFAHARRVRATQGQPAIGLKLWLDRRLKGRRTILASAFRVCRLGPSAGIRRCYSDPRISSPYRAAVELVPLARASLAASRRQADQRSGQQSRCNQSRNPRHRKLPPLVKKRPPPGPAIPIHRGPKCVRIPCGRAHRA